MKKNTFLIHLNSLRSAEVTKFGIYLKATNPQSIILLKIYDFYIKFYNKKKSLPKYEFAYKKIFGKKHQSEKDIRNLQNGISDLFLKLKEYLIQKKILETTFEKEFLWFQILEERGLGHQQKLQLKKLKKEKKEANNIWNSLQELKVHHYEFFRNDFSKNIVDLSVVQDGMKYLDDFYTNMKLKYAAETLNRAFILNVAPSKPYLINPLLALFKKDEFEFTCQNKLYYYLYVFLQKRNLEKYKQLKHFLEENEETLHKEERLTALIYMLNFMAEELKKGKDYAKETFSLYEMGLGKAKLLVYNDLIDTTHFFNIINVACRLKKFEWVEDFIENYGKYLKQDKRKQNKTNAWAFVFFEKGEYEKVLEILKEVNFDDILFEVVARVLILSSYFELGQLDDLETYCDTFIRFVKRNKNLGETNRFAAINFAKILKHFIKKTMPKNQLKTEIKEKESLFFKSWLEQKLKNYAPIK